MTSAQDHGDASASPEQARSCPVYREGDLVLLARARHALEDAPLLGPDAALLQDLLDLQERVEKALISKPPPSIEELLSVPGHNDKYDLRLSEGKPVWLHHEYTGDWIEAPTLLQAAVGMRKLLELRIRGTLL